VATYLAGVDIGTSGAKGMVFDLNGNPLASAYREHPSTTYPRPAWVEQDADHLVEAAMDAMAVSKKLKISRIHLTNSPEYGRLRHRSLLFRTRSIFIS
jgi:sugar (pentulose or hexulose) kinase